MKRKESPLASGVLRDMTEAKAAEIVRTLLTKHFGGDYATPERIEKSVWEGDPKEWTRNALVTIWTEECLPDASDMEAWCPFNEDLWGEGLCYEPVNGAIIGVYAN